MFLKTKKQNYAKKLFTKISENVLKRLEMKMLFVLLLIKR